MNETTIEERMKWKERLQRLGSLRGRLGPQDLFRLIADVERLEKERETEAKRWAEYLDWLSWIADCANDSNYGSALERLSKIAQAVKDQEKKETPPFVEFIWDRMLTIETKCVQTEAQLEKVIQLGRNIVNNIRAMKGGDQASLYEFSDFLISLEKKR